MLHSLSRTRVTDVTDVTDGTEIGNDTKSPVTRAHDTAPGPLEGGQPAKSVSNAPLGRTHNVLGRRIWFGYRHYQSAPKDDMRDRPLGIAHPLGERGPGLAERSLAHAGP